MAEEQALALLHKCASTSTSTSTCDGSAPLQLVRELSCLPLAVEAVGSLISPHRISAGGALALVQATELWRVPEVNALCLHRNTPSCGLN
jgi:hypothetical protein